MHNAAGATAPAPAGTVPPAPAAAETLLDVLRWHADRHGDRLHLRFLAGDEDVQPLTYRELLQGALEVAAGLQARGVVPDAKVAIMLPTSLDFFHAFFGVLLAGAVPVPIYPPVRRQQVEQLLRRQAASLDNAEAVMLITFAEAKPAARFLRAKARGVHDLMTVADLRGGTGGFTTVARRGSDLAFLQYTSGSTGSPKGVMLTHANLVANVRTLAVPCGLDGLRDTFVSWLPLYHDMGLIGAWLGSLFHGVPFVIMSPQRFLTRPERWLWAMHNYRATISAAPNFAYELCRTRIKEGDLRGLDLSSMRVLANGAEPVLPATLRGFQERFERFGLSRTVMRPVYGLAECSVGLAFPNVFREPRVDRIRRERFTVEGIAEPAAPDDATALEFVACGVPLPEHEMRVVDVTGRALPERRAGAIQFRGPSASQGYYRNAQATAALYDGTWLRTGDRGYLADGEIFIAGRDKDIIIRAGRNLHAPEIEAAAGEVRGIRKGCIAAFGLAGASGTERMVVLAETRATDPAILSRLADDVRKAIVAAIGEPPDKVVLTPPHVVLKTSSGKIRRADTRGLYERGEHLRGRPPAWIQMLRLYLSALRADLGAVGARLLGGR
ncbi:MAG: fatty acyl-AMP ligase [Alphaproteobacteria bacterium]|nr:fatty acyl-AMP ligase [Alphaproteobacteria bacterium]